jgi:quaternary ammonium compound-resistance protein SugE
MAWILLVVAGLFEVGWAIGLKYTDGFTRLVPTALTLTTMAISVFLLGLAAKSLPIGTAYAVWVGIGAVGAAVMGIWLFGESASAPKLVSLALIVAGIVGLKLSGSAWMDGSCGESDEFTRHQIGATPQSRRAAGRARGLREELQGR